MSYTTTVYKVMIASPSDVATERQAIRDVIHEWNSINSEDRNIVLMPVGWETHSSPLMGGRPQQFINKQVLADCDLLVAAFWTRIGSPTGLSPSGTVEEIEEHLVAGKPAMIYFSTAPVRPDSVEDEQYTPLQEFKKQCQERGLIETYESISEFREKFARQLAMTVIRNYAATQDQGRETDSVVTIPRRQLPELSDTSRELLTEAVMDQSGVVIRVETLAGLQIQTNGREFVEPRDPRSAARWDSALQKLCDNGLLQDKGYKGEVFSVTDYGYEAVD